MKQHNITKLMTSFLLSSTSLSPMMAAPGDSEPAEHTQKKRPNIVFVFSDDHAFEAIGAYSKRFKGYTKTPHLDRLAAEGMVFENSYCANSICGPSRACILTGKHSHLNGFRQNAGGLFDGSQWTFPKTLQAAGYSTALFGKWHLTSDPTGFDTYSIVPGQGCYYQPTFYGPDGKRVQEKGYISDIVTQKALNWIEAKKDNKPFMLMVQHKAPHRNWSPPLRYVDLYKDITLPEPETLFDQFHNRHPSIKRCLLTFKNDFCWGNDAKFHGPNLFPGKFPILGKNGRENPEYGRMTPEEKAAWDASYEPRNQEFIRRMKNNELSDKDIVKWMYQRYVKDYLATSKSVDDSVGTIVKYLDKNNLSNDTIVIYSSDQGVFLGEHGWYDKRWMFNESFEMPFIIRWKGHIKPNTRSKALIQNIDYAPTFLDIAGIKAPDHIQGTSLMPLLKADGKKTPGWRDTLYYHLYEGMYRVSPHDGVCTERYKLFKIQGDWQLYDLQKDPLEIKSVHDDPEYAAILNDMQRRYEAERKRYRVSNATTPGYGKGSAWRKKMDAQIASIATCKPTDIVLAGDDLFDSMPQERFVDMPATLKFCDTGERTEWMLQRLRRLGRKKAKPNTIVLLIGTNNLLMGNTPGETAAGVCACLREARARLPKTKVLLLGLLPRPGDLEFNKKAEATNRLLRCCDAESMIEFLDMNALLKESPGTGIQDLLNRHLSGLK